VLGGPDGPIPDGEELLEDQDEPQRLRYRGEWVTRTLRRERRIPDNDLPGIAAAYRAFRAEHSEPGQGSIARSSVVS